MFSFIALASLTVLLWAIVAFVSAQTCSLGNQQGSCEPLDDQLHSAACLSMTGFIEVMANPDGSIGPYPGCGPDNNLESSTSCQG